MSKKPRKKPKCPYCRGLGYIQLENIQIKCDACSGTGHTTKGLIHKVWHDLEET